MASLTFSNQKILNILQNANSDETCLTALPKIIFFGKPFEGVSFISKMLFARRNNLILNREKPDVHLHASKESINPIIVGVLQLTCSHLRHMFI